ncbi:MAG: hypothetical protein ACLU9S_09240 [Oscillospiraceae bacterium]
MASVTSQGFGTGLRHAVFRRITIPVPRGAGSPSGTPVLINRVTARRQSAPVRGGHADPAGDPGAPLFVRGWDRHGHDHRSAAVTGDYQWLSRCSCWIIARGLMRKTVPLYRTVQGRLDKLTRVLRENLSGVRVIRAFARTDKEQKRVWRARRRNTPPPPSGSESWRRCYQSRHPADHEPGPFWPSCGLGGLQGGGRGA